MEGSLQREEAYLSALAARMDALLGARLAGVYAGGSWALGDYRPGRSDLDVAAVVDDGLDAAGARQLVDALRHEALPCPARALELVVYSRAVARSGTTAPGFELNLNTGPGVPERVDGAGSAVADTHWFALDRAVLAAHGRTLAGPPASALFTAAPADRLRVVLADALRWWARAAGDPLATADAVLNACRALRWARERAWSSKRAAGAWALGPGRLSEDAALAPATVAAALAALDGEGPPVDPGAARAFAAAAAACLAGG